MGAVNTSTAALRLDPEDLGKSRSVRGEGGQKLRPKLSDRPSVSGMSAAGAIQSGTNPYSELDGMAATPALRTLANAGRDLLLRTAELPDTEQGLLFVLAEYRYLVFTFAAIANRL